MNREVVVEIAGLLKDYRGLRPLRIQQLTLRQGESVALLGFDQPTTEVFVNLLTGASTPDRGDVRVFGQSTTAIADGDAWLTSLDRFGILSERAVLLDQLTVEQNLAVPFSLELNPVPPAVQRQVAQLAEDVGLDAADLARTVGSLTAAARLRVRFGRAIALGPRLLLAEHPNAGVPAEDLPAVAADLSRVIAARGLASLTFTADPTFASAVAEQVLTLKPASGELARASGWRRWWSR